MSQQSVVGGAQATGSIIRAAPAPEEGLLLTLQTSPVTGTTSYSYDSAGNLTASTDANGVTTTRVYDALNRVTAATATGATSEVTTWTYDGTAPFANGRLTSMTDPTGATSYSYERRSLLTTAADSDGITTSFAYDADGNRTRLGYPSGRVVQTAFDFAGRPVAASSDGTAIVNSASYLPFGPMTSLAYGNGTTKTMLYDNRYRSQENKLTTATAVIADYLYQEDAVGNITQIHDATNAAYNRDFGYDDLNRLTTANTGSALWGNGGYQYDAMGNMTSLHVGSRSLSFAYAGTTPRIQSVSGTNPETVTYDNAGNEVSAGRYSPRNLLEGIGNGDPRMEPGLSLGYSYDGRGVRILTSLTTPGMPPWGGTKTRRSVYSPELHLLSQSAWSGEDVELGERAGRSSSLATRTRSPRAALTLAAIRPTTVVPIGGSSVGTDYIWFADQPVAQAFTDPSQPVRYTFTDHLGTPILQTDATAAVVWRVEYEPYGSIYTYRVGDANDPQALRLPGQEAPESVNTAGYNIFRWYRTEWGRYTQADPLEWSGQEYTYASDNAIDNTDRLGLFDAGSAAKQAARRAMNLCEEEGSSVLGGPVVGALLILMQANDANPPEFENQVKKCAVCKRKDCRPCIPVVGTLAYREDMNPSSPPHRGVPPPHWHLYQMNQNPNNCQCFWKPVPDNRGGFGASPPPAGAIPITPAAGGGQW